MQSQTSNGTVKLLTSDMQKAQRIIEAMRDKIGSSNLVVSVINGEWFLDWTGPDGVDYFPAGSDSLDEAFARAMRRVAEMTK